MKITRNTTPFDTRDVRRVICAVHAIMAKMEGRTAPNWKGLRVVLRSTSKNHSRGWAYFHGRGRDWDVHLTLPKDITEQRLAWLVYHELMHTFGYRHRQYTNAKPHELAAWFPANAPIKLAAPKARPAKSIQQVRHERVVRQLATWETKAKRAANAIKKLKAKVRYYERAAAAKENAQ